MNGYIFLLVTIILETAAVILMKLSNGFTNKIYFVSGLLAFVISFVFLSLALKTLPMGWTNAIWAGSSTLLVCCAGILFFNEKINVPQGLFLLLIIIGLVGFNFFGNEG